MASRRTGASCAWPGSPHWRPRPWSSRDAADEQHSSSTASAPAPAASASSPTSSPRHHRRRGGHRVSRSRPRRDRRHIPGGPERARPVPVGRRHGRQVELLGIMREGMAAARDQGKAGCRQRRPRVGPRTITRSDGTEQVTYKGHPLYYFIADSSAGEHEGTGERRLRREWWLVAPSGTAITAGGSTIGLLSVASSSSSRAVRRVSGLRAESSRGPLDVTDAGRCRDVAGTAAVAGTGAHGAARPRPGAGRPIGPLAFAGVAISSFGGPLALAALSAPALAADAADSAGLAMVAAGRRVHRAARDLDAVHPPRPAPAACTRSSRRRPEDGSRSRRRRSRIFSYAALRRVHDGRQSSTTCSRPSRRAPVPDGAGAGDPGRDRAASMIAGAPHADRPRVVAAGQVALAGILDGVTLAHYRRRRHVRNGAPAGSLARRARRRRCCTSAQPAVASSGPARPTGAHDHARRGRGVRAHGRTDHPRGRAAGRGSGSAPHRGARRRGRPAAPRASASRTRSASGSRSAPRRDPVRVPRADAADLRDRPLADPADRGAIGALIVLAAPISLIDPDGFYDALLKPSLVALWLSQRSCSPSIPGFAKRHRQRASAGVDTQRDRERVRGLSDS